jgi:hypothetical protein
MLFLVTHQVAVADRFVSIGNDFRCLYYSYKVYLLDCLRHLQWPLWSPSEAAGYPFFFNPFAQTLYPGNLPLAVFCRLAGGYTALDHQRFAILGLSIFALGLFLWLRQIKISLRGAAFAALIMPVSFKMLEILRFPNAIHSAAWYPWILCGLTGVLAAQAWKRSAAYGVLLLFSLICLATGGYPYYLYYSLFLFPPYVAMFVFPHLRRSLVKVTHVRWKMALSVLLLVGVLAYIIMGPYLSSIASLMQQTADRGGRDFAFSTEYRFNWLDTVGSLVFPLSAQFEGWYFFGSAGVLLIIVYLFGGDHASPSTWVVQACLLIWFGVISYITYGSESVLFRVLWNYLPGFSSLRVWGRMNIILVPLLAWLLALAYDDFEARLATGVRLRAKAVLVGGTIVVLASQLWLFCSAAYDEYWVVYGGPDLVYLINSVARKGGLAPMSLEALNSVLGTVLVVFTVIAFCMISGFLRSAAPSGGTPRALSACPMLMLAGCCILNIWPIGPWVWTSGFGKCEARAPLNVAELNQRSLSIPRVDRRDTISCSAVFNVGFVPNWYLNRYVAWYRRAAREPEARQALLGVHDGRRLFFSKAIDHSSVQSFLDDAQRMPLQVLKAEYTGDRMAVGVAAPEDGYLSFIDNWVPEWKATVDGTPREIVLLFGTFKAIRVPAGTHEVVFEYRPRLWWF